MINNKIVVVALEQSSTKKQKNPKTMCYVLWKKQMLSMVMHFYEEVKNRIATKMDTRRIQKRMALDKKLHQ